MTIRQSSTIVWVCLFGALAFMIGAGLVPQSPIQWIVMFSLVAAWLASFGGMIYSPIRNRPSRLVPRQVVCAAAAALPIVVAAWIFLIRS